MHLEPTERFRKLEKFKSEDLRVFQVIKVEYLKNNFFA